MLLQLNVNDYVHVRLTPEAEQVERDRYMHLKLDPAKHIHPADNRWRRFHLHELMNLFGHEMYMGNVKRMFVDNEIRLIAGAS